MRQKSQIRKLRFSSCSNSYEFTGNYEWMTNIYHSQMNSIPSVVHSELLLFGCNNAMMCNTLQDIARVNICWEKTYSFRAVVVLCTFPTEINKLRWLKIFRYMMEQVNWTASNNHIMTQSIKKKYFTGKMTTIFTDILIHLAFQIDLEIKRQIWTS